MKRSFSILIAALLFAGCLSACAAPADDTGRIDIVATVFPEYDWVMNVLGDNPANAEVTLLLSNGVDLHSFQPSARDVARISACDIFIYVGGESDDWVKDALREAANKNMKIINLLETLGDAVKEEQVQQGMQGEADGGYDEHVWLSLKNAVVVVEKISLTLQQTDPDHAELYRKNAEEYVKKLSALDSRYEQVVANASKKALLFGDRFPFRYLVDDYGLDYYAAFSGCSAETEASFETITFLAKKADELGISAVLVIDGADRRIAETIIRNTETKDQRILVLDSMQSVTMKDVQNGVSYISIMENDLDVLAEALD